MNRKNPTLELSSHLENPLVEKLLARPPGELTDLAGLYGSSPYFLLALLSEAPGKRVLHVCEQREQCARAARNISSFKGTEIPVLLSRGMEKNRSLFEKTEITEPERLHSIFRWKETGILCADAAALAEVLAPPRALEAESFAMEEGTRTDRGRTRAKTPWNRLQRGGFHGKKRGHERPGLHSGPFLSRDRGALSGWSFFADRVNSLREFSPATQKSIGKKQGAVINPASFAVYRQNRQGTPWSDRFSPGPTARGLPQARWNLSWRRLRAVRTSGESNGSRRFFWDSRQCVLDYPREDLIVSLPIGFDEKALLLRTRGKIRS